MYTRKITQLPKIQTAFPNYTKRTVQINKLDRITITGYTFDDKCRDSFYILHLPSGKLETFFDYVNRTQKNIKNEIVIDVDNSFVVCRQPIVNNKEMVMQIYVKVDLNFDEVL